VFTKLPLVRAICLCLGFALATPATAVVGGKPIWVPGSAEEAVIRTNTIHLVYAKDGSFVNLCSATSFGPNTVLTAGHCFRRESIQNLVKSGRVFAEIFDPKGPGQIRRIPATDLRFDISPSSDLALLKLSFAHGLPVTQPTVFRGCDPGSPIFVAGFGVSRGNDRIKRVQRAVYKEISDPVIRDQIIAQRLIWFPPGSDPNYAAGWTLAARQSGVACSGDSGGPAYCRSGGVLSLIGVISSLHRHGRLKSRDEKLNTKADDCKDHPYLSISRISPNRATLNDWQTQLEKQSAVIESSESAAAAR